MTTTTTTIRMTDHAKEKVLEFMKLEEKEGHALRVACSPRGPRGFEYALDLVPEDSRRDDDEVVDAGEFRMLIDAASAPYLEGVSVDFVERGLQSGFKFENPNPRWPNPVAQRVQEVLDQEINPAIAGHGGFVTLMDVEGDTAYITMGGGCQGCGQADVTLRQGVEVAILNAVPEIQQILDHTDHAAGTNPYYERSADGDSPF